MSDVSQRPGPTIYSDWISDREVVSLGTNAGAGILPFQDWRTMKEAFAPELVARALNASPIPVQRCIDPFGGSGTTGLACQFLGVHPIMAEVNPFLADLIEAKLTSYSSPEELRRDLDAVIEASIRDVSGCTRDRFASAPRTLIEPGHNGRWIFDGPVMDRIVGLLDAIEGLDEAPRRLFRVILGGILVEVSNVVVSGKGRRYRRGWRKREIPPTRVTEIFFVAARKAIGDIRRFSRRPVMSYEMRRGDSRVVLKGVESCELAVFSPPYPNSSDYTDIFNVELWALGYLNGSHANSNLRSATLSSHVQKSRKYSEPPVGSPTLEELLESLNARRNEIWNRKIPAMVGAYFSDLMDILDDLSRVLVRGGSAWMVLGDSRYAGVHISATKVLQELVVGRGWEVLGTEPFRSMPTSAQQGSERVLSEQLLVLRNVAY